MRRDTVTRATQNFFPIVMAEHGKAKKSGQKSNEEVKKLKSQT